VTAAVRVLVVDDDPVALEAHAAYVERVPGFVVVARAPAGAEALRVLGTAAVDLVLLDVHLPDMSGLDVLRRMRSAGRTTDVIMVTRARDLDVVRAAIAFGATQYLVKPFTAGAVRAKLEGHLAYRAQDGPVLDQGGVDGLLDTLRAPVESGGRPKGVSRESLDGVSGALAAADGARTAAEVAELAGVSRVTARRYLEHLADTGLADRSLRYGGAGRPQVQYRWRPAGATD
jgi:response regulator of citrate/malate metabolism